MHRLSLEFPLQRIIEDCERRSGFMTRAKRKAKNLDTALTTGLVLSALMTLACCHVSLAGNHHIESPAHRCAGCIDGSCGVPSPYGYYRGGWRRWPGSRDSTMDDMDQGTTPREPVVPEPAEEGRTRPRTRSDKPLDPDELADALEPMIPGAMDEANPFSNSVPESDLPAPGTGAGNPFGGGDPGGLVPTPTDGGGFDGGGFNGGGAGESLFDNDVTAPGGDEIDFGPAGGDDLPADDPGDVFDFSGPTRSIKSRGLQLQKGIQLNSVASLPTSVTGPGFDLPFDDSVGGRVSEKSVGLVSFDEFAPSDFESLSNPQPKPLSGTQVEEAIQLQSESTESNPLRRGRPNLRRKTASTSQTSQSNLEQLLASDEVIIPEASAPVEPKTAPVTRSLATAASSRSLRSNLRPNPLRR